VYGHVNQYLDSERLRLRAERAERLMRAWRGAAFTLLALLVVQTWLVIDTSIEMRDARQLAQQRLDSVSVWHIAATNQTSNLLDAKYDEARWYKALQQSADKRWDAEDKRWAAEEKFRVCLVANAGLVETLHEFDRLVKDQQQVIRDSIEAAQRCDASPAPAVNVAGWEVVSVVR
jgi:hypothetical protein